MNLDDSNVRTVADLIAGLKSMPPDAEVYSANLGESVFQPVHARLLRLKQSEDILNTRIRYVGPLGGPDDTVSDRLALGKEIVLI